MAIETFTWRTQGQPEGSYSQRVRTTQFSDGYKQVTGNGINIETQTWPLSFSGQKAEMLPMLAFFRAHTLGQQKNCVKNGNTTGMSAHG